MLKNPKLSTTEGPLGSDNPPASFKLALSKAPSTPVTVVITCDAQLGSPTPNSFTFTPANWDTEQEATVSALDDTQVEGQHSGSCNVTVASSDAEFGSMEAPAVTIDIKDNDCAPVPIPANGAKLFCEETYGGSCRVQCNPGFAPAPEQQLYCNAVTGQWQQPMPTCDRCDVGFYNSSTTCVPCSTTTCPEGMYRSPCSGSSDGEWPFRYM
jgi:hypothetical protein